jgi:cytochrome P450 family 6
MYHVCYYLPWTGLSTDEILGQAFLFFTAGYETTATLLQFAAYELVVNQDIQDKVAREIQEVMQGVSP